MSTARMLGKVLLSRPVGALSLVALAVIFFGCMSLSIGERKVIEEKIVAAGSADDVLCQEGKISFARGSAQTVYYPVPYALPPNLEIKERGPFPGDVILVEQKDDHFLVRTNGAGSPVTMTWRARGVRRPLPPMPTGPPADPPPPAGPALPARPVPIDAPLK